MIDAVVQATPQAGPAERLLAFYAQAQASPETEAAAIAAADKLTFEMIEETARWRKAGLRLATLRLSSTAKPGRSAISCGVPRAFGVGGLHQVKKLCGEREAEEFKVRWEEAFAEGEAAPKEDFKEKLEAATARLAKAKAEPERPNPKRRRRKLSQLSSRKQFQLMKRQSKKP